MRWLKKIDTLLDGWCPFLIPLALLTLLKLPSFFEPYWYGDEAIYLTIGNALRDGQRMYAEIIDHKTPLIYYLAMTPHQFWFRVLMFVWMVISTYLFFILAKDVIGVIASHGKTTGLKRLLIEWPALIATLFFVLFTSLPSFEGNIPNGELFVMGFMLMGWWFLRKHTTFQHFLGIETDLQDQQKSQQKSHLLLGGVFLGLGILTKVPGLFDAAALMSVPVLVAWQYFLKHWRHPKSWWLHIKPHLISFSWIGIGMVGTILASVLYYTLRGSLSDYIQFGLLYNFRYAGYWAIPVTDPTIVMLMTLSGKAAVVGASLGLMLFLGRYIPTRLQFILVWCWFALFGSLLSNRPYPHYFLQLAPALSLLVGYSISNFLRWFRPSTLLQGNLLPAVFVVWFLVVCGGAITSVGISLALNRLSFAGDYYRSFFDTIRGNKSWAEYGNAFDRHVADNTRAAEIITKANVKQIFIWGTNPSLYAQTQTYPTGRFTVSFHIKDFNAYNETYQSVVDGQPEFVVVMKEEEALPELQTYLQHNYIPNDSFTHFTLWRRYSGV